MTLATKKTLLLCFVLATALIAGYFYITTSAKQTLALPNNQKINVEIADTPAKQARGLMYRNELGADSGMLFIFYAPAKHIFWMKNTYIPLDMLWLDEDLKIVTILENVPPCKTDPCPSYMPTALAKYVLEINAGKAKEWDLKTGDQLTLED